MAHAPLDEVRPGDLLAGKYRIERVLGRGGMGVVVAALHETLDERVALKFLLPEALESAEAVERFLREARAAVKIRSEHVARVTDVGTLDSGSPYMVMEYLDGVDLARYLEMKGPLPVEEAVEYVLQACEALAEAHSRGIIHRDLKPANLFRTERADGTPSIKLLDFGISKIVTQDVSITRTSSMMGSPLYMAPEQMTSAKRVDVRADIWALGIILHELLTADVPFTGTTIPELCASILTEPPRSTRSSRHDVPEALEAVLARCLQKNRDQRYPSVAELAVDLRPFAPTRALISVDRVSRVVGMSRDAAEPQPVPARTNSDVETQGSWGETTGSTRARSRRSWGLAVALSAVVVSVVLASAFAFSTGETTTAASAPEALPEQPLAAAAAPQDKAAPADRGDSPSGSADSPGPTEAGPAEAEPTEAEPVAAPPAPAPLPTTKPKATAATTAKPTTTTKPKAPAAPTAKPKATASTTTKPKTSVPRQPAPAGTAAATEPAKPKTDFYLDRK